jgi:hypothetical protein
MIPRVWSFMKFYPFNKFLKICIKKFYFRFISFKYVWKIWSCCWFVDHLLSDYRYMLWCDHAIDLYWGAPNSNMATRCLKSWTVTRWLHQLNQLMGATVGYCVLLSAYICLLLNPTSQKIVAMTVNYMHYVVSLDAVGGVYVNNCSH